MLKRLLLTVATLTALSVTAPAWADPIPPSATISSVTVSEGNSGLKGFEANVTLVGAPAGSTYTVDVVAVPEGADESDYVFMTVRLLIPAGSGPQAVQGFVVGDTVVEDDETFKLRAYLIAPGTGAILSSQDGTVTILDDDDPMALRLTIDPTTSVPEGNDGWRAVSVTARLSAPAKDVVIFRYEIAGGQPDVYREGRGTTTIPPGETLAAIPVEIFGDTRWEPDTSFDVRLSDVRGARLAGDVGKVLVTNDDPLPTIFAMDVTVDEGDTDTKPASILFTFSPPVQNDAQLTLTLVGGLAVAGADFVFEGPKTVNLPAGTAELSFPIEVRGDTTPECDEGLTVRFRAFDLGDDGVHEVRLTIRNDDDPHPQNCPDPFMAVPVQHPGRQIDAAIGDPDGGTPPADGGAPVNPPGTPIDGGGLTKRRGCACSAAPDAPSFGALLVLGAAWLATRRRSRSSARRRQS